MLLLIVFAFLAGLVTILSPCILPILPIILSASVGTGRRKPLGIVSGFILSFTFFTLFLSTLVRATGISADALRTSAIVVIAGFGLFLIIPQAQVWLEKLFSQIAGKIPQTQTGDGFWGGLVIGLSLGLLWAPCVGPILASVITLAITSQVSLAAVLITVAYSIGTAIPMLTIIFTGRTLLQKNPWLLKNTAHIQQAFGVVMILTALAIFFNIDRKFQTYVLETFPQYGTGLTKFEETPVVNQRLLQLNGERTTRVKNLQSSGPMAPELTGGQQWFNSQPLSLSSLRGKVVLIDFWTYSCINCIRTLPYLKGWDARYRDRGLVVIGVHAPEFEFEKNADNVAKAVRDFGLTYPIVQDNELAIWTAYKNNYWPAKYLIDAQGKIRYTHFGEGEYDTTEKAIQTLLEEAGQTVSEVPLTTVAVPITNRQTPETYLGYARSEHFVNRTQFKPDETVIYAAEKNLQADEWQLAGAWKVTNEHLTSQAAATELSTLQLAFQAKDVYLVMGSETPKKIQVAVDSQLKWLGTDVAADGTLTVEANKLYHIVAASEFNSGVVTLQVPAGVDLFAFTFGS